MKVVAGRGSREILQMASGANSAGTGADGPRSGPHRARSESGSGGPCRGAWATGDGRSTAIHGWARADRLHPDWWASSTRARPARRHDRQRGRPARRHDRHSTGSASTDSRGASRSRLTSCRCPRRRRLRRRRRAGSDPGRGRRIRSRPRPQDQIQAAAVKEGGAIRFGEVPGEGRRRSLVGDGCRWPRGGSPRARGFL